MGRPNSSLLSFQQKKRVFERTDEFSDIYHQLQTCRKGLSHENCNRPMHLTPLSSRTPTGWVLFTCDSRKLPNRGGVKCIGLKHFSEAT